MTHRAKGTEYRCLMCADRVISRKEVERHLLRHYLDETIVEFLLPEEEDDESC